MDGFSHDDYVEPSITGSEDMGESSDHDDGNADVANESNVPVNNDTGDDIPLGMVAAMLSSD